MIMIMGELKILNDKLLTAKEVVEIMAAENPIVYDSENCYNLELEVKFFLNEKLASNCNKQ